MTIERDPQDREQQGQSPPRPDREHGRTIVFAVPEKPSGSMPGAGLENIWAHLQGPSLNTHMDPRGILPSPSPKVREPAQIKPLEPSPRTNPAPHPAPALPSFPPPLPALRSEHCSPTSASSNREVSHSRQGLAESACLRALASSPPHRPMAHTFCPAWHAQGCQSVPSGSRL